jgi:catechol 2,3-dioxygenase-like lactoylglutathione lyase family enzyme
MTLELEGLCPLIQVFDMRTSLRFYRDVLGFAVVMQAPAGDAPDWVLLRLGEAELMLNTAYEAHERPPAPDPARIAAHRDTGLFLRSKDVDAVHEHLRAKGLDVEKPAVTSYGMKQLYVQDPDGYVLCFQRRAAEIAPRYGSGGGSHR